MNKTRVFNRSTVFLGFSLVVLTIICVAVLLNRADYPRNEVSSRFVQPKGIPPSQRTQEVPFVPEPVSPAKETKVAPTKEFSPAAELITVNAHIIDEIGHVVTGGRLVAQVVTVNRKGFKDTTSPFRWTRMESAVPSDDDGYTHAKLRIPAGVPDDTLVEIAAMHPEKGTGYAEANVAELRAGDLLDVTLEIGDVVQGRVLDADGEPVAGIVVEVSTETPANGVVLSGIGVYSQDDGSFVIPGIRFDNIPQKITASFSDHRLEDGLIVTEALNGEYTLLEKDYDANRGAWEAGDIVVEKVTLIQDPEEEGIKANATE